MKNILTAIVVMAAVLASLYFFWHKPAVDEAFKKGRETCEKDIDTLWLKGDTAWLPRDSSFAAEDQDVDVEKDSVTKETTYVSNFDTSYVSGKDSLSISANVKIKVDSTGFSLADWFMHIAHRDFYKEQDTVKIYLPKYIEGEIVYEKDWKFITYSFIAGVLTAITIFVLAL